MLRTVSLYLLSGFFMVAGVNHFLNPAPYLAMMPPYVPWPEAANAVSGAAEVVGGIAVLWPRWRRAGGWGLLALLVAVFPANLQVALHGWPGVAIPRWVLWARLPMQALLMVWVYRTCLSHPRKQP